MSNIEFQDIQYFGFQTINVAFTATQWDLIIKQDSADYDLFTGLVFWGSEHLPKDLVISLGDIRQWAIDQQLIWDDEAQFVASERIAALNLP
ncbi:MAG: hypothetical protein KAU38_08150 [Desulfobacterales bacterium]|nr:hypothetical protein [Desulfobacterales bacterium]